MSGYFARTVVAPSLGSLTAPACDRLAAAAARLAGRSPAGAPAIFDLETTGLGVAEAVAFVVGIAAYDEDGRFAIHQFRLDSVSGEAAMWDDVVALLARLGRHGLVSYNGASFDRHLAMIRMRRLGRWTADLHDLFFARMIDLLPICRRVFGHRYPDRRLLALEGSELGAPPRQGDRSGMEIAAIGQAWLAGARSAATAADVEAVLHHNALDLVGTAALVAACDTACEDSHCPADVLAASGQFLASGQSDRARVRLRAALARHGVRRGDPSSVELALRLAELDRRAGDRDAAARTWRAIAASWPGHPRACEALAKDCEHRLADPVQALVWALAGGCDPRRIERLRSKVARRAGAGSRPVDSAGAQSAEPRRREPGSPIAVARRGEPECEIAVARSVEPGSPIAVAPSGIAVAHAGIAVAHGGIAAAPDGEPGALAVSATRRGPTPHPRLGTPGSWRV